MEEAAKRQRQLIVVGLDIGTTKICVTVGRRTSSGKIEVLGMGKAESTGVARGVVANIQRTVQSIKQAIELAAAQSNVDIKIVNVGIAGQHIKSIQHRGSITRSDASNEITRKDIERLCDDMYKLAMPPGEEIIHVLPQEFTIDGEPGEKDPIGRTGVRLEASFHIISGQVTAIKNITRSVRNAGLEPTELVLEPLASSEAVLSPEEKEAGVALIDIGGGTTDIAIFYDGIIRHTAVIPFGGNSITEDIREGLSVMRNQAEQLKVKFGSALAVESAANEIICVPGFRGREPKEISVQNLAHIIQARMEEIIEHAYYEIKNSGYEKKLIAGVVITGGGSSLKHLPQLVEYITGLDCRIGYPSEHLAKYENMSKSDFEQLKSPMYATGVGLLIKGIEKAEEELLEADIVKGDRADSKTRKNPKAPRSRGFFTDILEKATGFIKDDMHVDDKDYTSR